MYYTYYIIFLYIMYYVLSYPVPHRCLRPPPIRPAAWEASVGGVRGYRVRGQVFV